MSRRAEPVHPDSPRGQLARIYDQALSRDLADNLDVLDAIAGLRIALDRQEDDAALMARRNGATWQQIADALGITRQRAHQRWHGPATVVGWGPPND